MHIISKKVNYFDVLVEKVDFKNVKFKKSQFNFVVKHDNVYLLHNTFSKSTIILNEKEYDSYNIIDENSIIFEFLVNNNFFVPVELDEVHLFNQIYETVELLENKEFIDYFNIFTTTKCNARCFYCFESGVKQYDMSIKTAFDIVKYIERVSKDRAINISWFGGEPLCNQTVIDIISKELNKREISFNSYIITNGYLFEENIIKKARDIWNLKRAMITIDGTEEKYNTIKNYIYKNASSPYKKVIKNINSLLTYGIAVHVKINLYNGNYEDAYKLTNELSDNFSKYSNFKIISSYIVDSNLNFKFSNEEKMKQYNRYIEFEDYLKSKKLLMCAGLNMKINGNKCLASNDHSTAILPNGDLAKCDVDYNKSIYGSIYSNEKNKEVLNHYKQRVDYGILCNDCIYLPNCGFLKNCPTIEGVACDHKHRTHCYSILEHALNNIYEDFKKSQNENVRNGSLS